jgi:hypothetical protein
MTDTVHSSDPLAGTPDQEDCSWWSRLRRSLAEINSREDYGTKLYP